MSGLQHLLEQATPGPWEAHGEWGSYLSNWWIDRPDTKTRRVPAPGHPDYSEPELARLDADAHLIALAPDMARLLIDMAAFLRGDYHPPTRAQGTALLARFAELDRRAAQ